MLIKVMCTFAAGAATMALFLKKTTVIFRKLRVSQGPSASWLSLIHVSPLSKQQYLSSVLAQSYRSLDLRTDEIGVQQNQQMYNLVLHHVP